MIGSRPLRFALAAGVLMLAGHECRAQQAELDHSIWHIKTTLWDADDLPDLVMIKKRPTGTGSTEVHIYSGASKYKTALVEVGTPLPNTDRTWEFVVADWNLDGVPDLWAISRDGQKNHKVEVHILSGALFFADFLVRAETPYDAVGPEAEFLAIPPVRDAAARPNLMMILREKTKTASTEIHVLDGASNFKNIVLQAGTALPETGTGPSWQFQAGDFNGDRVLDIVAVTSSNGGAVAVVDGRSNLKEFGYRAQLGDAGLEARLGQHLMYPLASDAIAKLEEVAADPKVPAGVGPKTPLMNGTFAAPAFADFYLDRTVSLAVREFQQAISLGNNVDYLRDELRNRQVGTRLEIVTPRSPAEAVASAPVPADGKPIEDVGKGPNGAGGRTWEYKFVPAPWVSGALGTVEAYEAFLNEMGKDGWEYVETRPLERKAGEAARPNTMTCIFKRPAQGAPDR